MDIRITSSVTRNSSERDPIAIREEHYERHFGRMSDAVAHSTDKNTVHVDIYQFEPSEARPYWTLVTGGMSDLPQRIPSAAEGTLAPRTEILMYAKTPQHWMLEILKTLAEFPFRRETFLHWYHTWTKDACITHEPSSFTSCLFLPPFLEDPSLNELQVQGNRVDFLWMIPITEREQDFAVSDGSEALARLLMTDEDNLIVHEGRKSVV